VIDVRRPSIVAMVALTAAFAVIAVPGPSAPRALGPFDPDAIDLAAANGLPAAADALDRGAAPTIEPLDPAARSDGHLGHHFVLLDPARPTAAPSARADAAQPDPVAGTTRRDRWRRAEASWYGPGFIGNRTACGQTLTRRLVGVAHRTLQCGTLIVFRHPVSERVVIAPVVDRGPYVRGRLWDLTYGLCKRLDHCYTGTLDWRYAPAD
jgi:rare lipoprotein A (peptidoglycan hydrolase)